MTLPGGEGLPLLAPVSTCIEHLLYDGSSEQRDEDRFPATKEHTRQWERWGQQMSNTGSLVHDMC